jgi:hypothetical protein
LKEIREKEVHAYVLSMDETVNLPVVLYGCKTWSLTLNE